MTQSIDDMFAGMASAPPQGQTGNGIKVEGDWLIEIVSTKGFKGYHGPKFIVEYRVLGGQAANAADAAPPVGATRSATMKWGDPKALADLKAFALAAWAPALDGLTQAQKDLQATYAVYAAAGAVLAGDASAVARQKLGGLEGDPFAGLQVRVSTKPTKTLQGHDFVKHLWSAVS